MTTTLFTIPHKFNSLKETADKINKGADAVSQYISTWNNWAVESNLGIECWLKEPIDPIPFDWSFRYSTQAVQLGYAKVNGAWQLAVRNVFLKDCTLRLTLKRPAGVFSARVGYQYFMCYSDDNGYIPTDTDISYSTGPFTNIDGVGIILEASRNPIANHIHVFRSSDSVPAKSQASTFFELPESPYPNKSQTIIDCAPDTTLNIHSLAPMFGGPDNVMPVLFGNVLSAEEAKPLLSASRFVRCQAAPYIERLAEAMMLKAESVLHHIDTNTKNIPGNCSGKEHTAR